MIDYRKIRNSKQCVVWTRVSTKYQEDNGGSLKSQKESCISKRHLLEQGKPLLSNPKPKQVL